MKKLLFSLLIFTACVAAAQTNDQEDIVAVIDALTLEWDEGAEKMRTYAGFRDFCHTQGYRASTVALLNKIHHYDTLLYQIVSTKFNRAKDPEAEATLRDIEEMESEYTTKSFLRFLHSECTLLNDIENNLAKKGGEEYLTEVKELEDELQKYVDAITLRIDLIDEHVHHLKGL